MSKNRNPHLFPGVPPPAPLPPPEDIPVEEVLRDYLEGKYDLLCVLGPTASGKTRYAVSLARKINSLVGRSCTHILSGDSRQVYRGMDIGTGKDLCEYGEIPYHLIDIRPAGSKYNIYEFRRDFSREWSAIRSSGDIPILCGGSGLYIEAVTLGYSLPEMEPDYALRDSLEKKDMTALTEELLRRRPNTAEGTLQSKRRVARALEVAIQEDSGKAPSRDDENLVFPSSTYFIGTLVSRERRIERIDRRLRERLDEGMIDEVKRLLDSGIAAEDLTYYGLEYKFVTQHILGILSYDEMFTLLSNAIHQFAKRQMTWFRGMEKKGVRIHWTVPG